MKHFLGFIVLLNLLLTAACDRIHEPWVRSEDQLTEERTRNPEAKRELRHRFMNVQTDR